MPRHFAETELIVASHNAGKVREISDLLAPYDIAIRSAASLGLPEPEETGASFVENAELKALAAVEASQKPALADDSGLVVPALGGQPGIYSARWGGPDRDFGLAMERVNAELGQGDRKAHFVAV
ncbi:MAG: non-canonical purine NTP pyrophosphatase, partial [Sphingomonadales bacterium]|nr:non-canonical purine NTP pyrophosphatase [Sphingomonadales bacterium]